MSKYAEKVSMREASQPCEYEDGQDGRVRCVFLASKLIHPDTNELVTHGPWCIDVDTARRWWTGSETARYMREGRTGGLS